MEPKKKGASPTKPSPTEENKDKMGDVGASVSSPVGGSGETTPVEKTAQSQEQAKIQDNMENVGEEGEDGNYTLIYTD